MPRAVQAADRIRTEDSNSSICTKLSCFFLFSSLFKANPRTSKSKPATYHGDNWSNKITFYGRIYRDSSPVHCRESAGDLPGHNCPAYPKNEPWDRWIYCKPSPSVSLIYILILSSDRRSHLASIHKSPTSICNVLNFPMNAEEIQSSSIYWNVRRHYAVLVFLFLSFLALFLELEQWNLAQSYRCEKLCKQGRAPLALPSSCDKWRRNSLPADGATFWQRSYHLAPLSVSVPLVAESIQHLPPSSILKVLQSPMAPKSTIRNFLSNLHIFAFIITYVCPDIISAEL